MGDRARQWLAAGGHFDWVPSQPLRDGNGLSIFHAEFGDPDAPLLALVHGFPTSSIDWFDIVGHLAADYRVVVLDLPGFGFSDKPKGERYTLSRDAELVGYYLTEVLGARSGAVVAHDRGDSVALSFANRCADGQTDFEVTDLVLSNGNIFLPLSSLNALQHKLLDPNTGPATAAALTPQILAAGMGQSTFTPARDPANPEIVALADTFAYNDGVAVMPDTIQYLVERSANERGWLDDLAANPVKTTLIWGLQDTIAPLRVAAYVWNTYLSTKAGDNEFWLLPRANHYPQNDQPAEFVQVLNATLSNNSPDVPGALSTERDAPVFLDRSRLSLPSASEVLRGSSIRGAYQV